MTRAACFVRNERDIGCSQAESFLAQLAGGAVESNALELAIEHARLGSRTRSRAFCARLQSALVAHHGPRRLSRSR